jgi:hypothetical protein
LTTSARHRRRCGEAALWERVERNGIRTVKIPRLRREVAPVADLASLLRLIRLIRSAVDLDDIPEDTDGSVRDAHP